MSLEPFIESAIKHILSITPEGTKEEKAKLQLELTKEINRAFEAIQADATKQFELEVKDRESARSMTPKQ